MQVWLRFGLLFTVTAAGAGRWVAGTDTTPAYYAVPPARPTHRLLTGEDLKGPYFSHPYQLTAYSMAAKVEKVLYSQPCHCRCDRALQHRSLHSCFEGTHGAECATCMREGIFTYQQTKLGRSPEQIREAIERGDAEKVDVLNAAL